MSDEKTNVPTVTEEDLHLMGLPSGVQMATGLQVFFNERMYEKCARLAGVMSKAEGMMQKHLLGKPEACFAVISRSITWNLDPFAVAQATYQTPGGAIGFMGVLVQAILENSGRLEGGLKFRHEGPWERVKGKFQIQESQRGGKYPVPTWTRDDAKGLKVVVSARVKGEQEDRVITVDLDECFPLNSPLWATSPSTQICYLAARRFANLAMPGVMMGVPFDVDPTNFYGEPMTDITPTTRPTRSEFERTAPTPGATTQAAAAPEKPKDGQTSAPTSEPAEQPAASAAQDATTQERAQATVSQDAEVVPSQTQTAQPGDESQDDDINVLQQRLIDDNKGALLSAKSVDQALGIWEEVSNNLLGEHLVTWDKICVSSAKNMRELGDLRKGAVEVLDGDREKAWEKLCDARSKEILNATKKPAQSGARK